MTKYAFWIHVMYGCVLYNFFVTTVIRIKVIDDDDINDNDVNRGS